jgi:hypothetical protein
MTLLSGERAVHRERAQGYTLKDAYAIADLSSFADDDSGAMVNAESASNSGAGVDIDSGHPMRVFAEKTGKERHRALIKGMCDSVHGNRQETWIGEYDLVRAFGGRVIFENRVRVFQQEFANRWEFLLKGGIDGIATGLRVQKGCDDLIKDRLDVGIFVV